MGTNAKYLGVIDQEFGAKALKQGEVFGLVRLRDLLCLFFLEVLSLYKVCAQRNLFFRKLSKLSFRIRLARLFEFVEVLDCKAVAGFLQDCEP